MKLNYDPQFRRAFHRHLFKRMIIRRVKWCFLELLMNHEKTRSVYNRYNLCFLDYKWILAINYIKS